jgi:hypothetical protein
VREIHFYPFVLTGSHGERIYGGTLLRIVPSSPVLTQATPSSANASTGRPKQISEALCVLSRFPFFSLFHDLLFHVHRLSRPPISSFNTEGSNGAVPGTGGDKKSKKKPATDHSSIGGAASAAAIASSTAEILAVAAASATRAESSGAPEVRLQVALGRGPLGLSFANHDAVDGRSRLFVVESKGQAEEAGVCIGDEIIELNGVPVKPGTRHYEFQQSILNARFTNPAVIILTIQSSSLRKTQASAQPLMLPASANPLLNEAELPRVSPCSLERLIPHIMEELRLPSSGGTVDIALGPGPRIARFIRSATGALPRVEDASFAILWQFLSIPTVIHIIEALLSERQVVLIADDVAVLAPIAEALLSFLFPFDWNHVYIPLLPVELLMYLEAPVPFFVGLSSAYLTLDSVAAVVYGENEGGAVCVFIDSDTITTRDSAHRDGDALPNAETEAATQIPSILRDQLLHGLEASLVSLRGVTRGISAIYGTHSSLASVAAVSADSVRRARQKAKLKMRHSLRQQRHQTGNRSSFRQMTDVPEKDEEACQEASPSTSTKADDSDEKTFLPDDGPVMDVDAARFHFLHLWTELLLPYTEFLQPSVAEKSKAAVAEKVNTGQSKDERGDERVVHEFDSAGFLAASPPTWRPFLQGLLETNLFQAFNHEACEALIRRSRNTRRPEVFFEKLTQSKTLVEMRSMVENSLLSPDVDGNRILHTSSSYTLNLPSLEFADKKHLRTANQTNCIMYFAYTVFPDLARQWGAGHAPSLELPSEPLPSLSGPASPSGRKKPDVPARSLSKRENLMDALESGEFRSASSFRMGGPGSAGGSVAGSGSSAGSSIERGTMDDISVGLSRGDSAQRFGSDASVPDEGPEEAEKDEVKPRPRAMSDSGAAADLPQDGTKSANSSNSTKNWLEEQEETLKKVIEGASFGLFTSPSRSARENAEAYLNSDDEDGSGEDSIKRHYMRSHEECIEFDAEELRLLLNKESLEEYFELLVSSGNGSVTKVSLLEDVKLCELGLQEIHALQLQRALLLVFFESQGLSHFTLTLAEAGYDTIPKVAALDEETLLAMGFRKAHVLKLQRSLDGWRAGDSISTPRRETSTANETQKATDVPLQKNEEKVNSPGFWDGLFGGSTKSSSDGIDELRSLYEKFLVPQQSLGVPESSEHDPGLEAVRSDVETHEKPEAELQSKQEFADDEGSSNDDKSKEIGSTEGEVAVPFWSAVEEAFASGFNFGGVRKK